MVDKIKQLKIPNELCFTLIFSMLFILLTAFEQITQIILTSTSAEIFIPSVSDVSDVSFYIIQYIAKICGYIPFVFVLGATLNFSKDKTSSYFKKGIILFAIASATQLFYGLIFCMSIVSVAEGETAWTFLHVVFSANFLHMIALCYIVIGALRATTLRGILLRIIAVVIAGIFCLINELTTVFNITNNIVDQLVGFILPSTGNSEFPLFAWFIIFAIGYLYGFSLRETKNKKALHIGAIIIGIIATIIIFCVSADEYQETFSIFTDGVLAYCWISPADAIATSIIASGIVGIFYFVSNIVPEKAKNLINKQYKVLIAAYVVQWYISQIIAYIKVYVFNSNEYSSALEFWLLFILFLILLVTVLNIYRVYIKNKFTPFFNKYWIPICAFAIIIPIALFIYADTIDDYLPSLVNGYSVNDNSL